MDEFHQMVLTHTTCHIPTLSGNGSVNGTCPQSGLQILNEILPFNVDEMFSTCFTESDLYLDFQEQRKNSDIVQTLWTDDTSDKGKSGAVSLTPYTNQSSLPTDSKVNEIQKFDNSDEDFNENVQKTGTHEIFINDAPDGETEESTLNSTCRSPTSSSTNPLTRDQRRVLTKEKTLNRKAEQVYKSAKFNGADGCLNTSQNKLSFDECEAFGKIVAAHLKQLPVSVALECQSDILHHLVRKRLGRSPIDSRIHSYTTENGTEEIIVQAWDNSN